MRDDIVAQCKYVVRKSVDLKRLASLCIGDHEVARAVAVRALRELADEIEQDGAGAVIEWDPILKIPVMKKRD